MASPAPHRPRRRVERVTLPRYDVFYATPAEALDDALRLREDGLMTLDVSIDVPVGADVVLDLRAATVPIHATLLFRVLQRTGDHTFLEFWARRQTDGDLLELWVESLKIDADERDERTPKAALNPVEMQRVLELCRRVLSRNPFTALGVHWSAPVHECHAAAQKAQGSLELVLTHGTFPQAVRSLVERALMRLPDAVREVSTAEGRKLARAKFVTQPQLAMARELAREKLEFARMRQDEKAIREAAAMLDELAPI